MKEIYSIFIADSNVALLEGLVSIISQEPTFEVVGTASNKSELSLKAPDPLPDLLLLDVDLTDLIGRGLPKDLNRLMEESKIILITEHWENSLIKRIKASGVMGCLKKSCDATELIYAMNRVLEGNPYFSGFHHKVADDRKHENTHEALLALNASSNCNSK